MRVFAERLQLLDHAGEFLRWLTPEEAEILVETRKYCEFRGTGRKVRAVQLVLADSKINGEFRVDLSVLRGQCYSHKRETRENPRGVWTFKRFNAPALEFV